MKSNLNKIEEILKNSKQFQVRPELNDRILKSLDNSRVEREFHETIKNPSNFISLFQKIMNSSKRLATVALVTLLAIGGITYLNQNSYAYHLNKAKTALAQLDNVLKGNNSQVTMIPIALAEEGAPVAVNEAQVTDLTATVVQETEKAIEIVDNKTDPVVVQQALTEIALVQEETVPVLAAATEAVVSAEATQVVSQALQTTTEQQVVVEQAKEFVALAASSGETNVAIDIETAQETSPVVEAAKEDEDKKDESEEKKLEEAKTQFEAAKVLVEKLKADGGVEAEKMAKLESKMVKIEEALKEGKVGRAFGLSTALQAEVKHLIRKAEKEDKEDKVKKDDDKNEEEEVKKEEKAEGDVKKDEEKKSDDDRNDDKKEEVRKNDKRSDEVKKDEDGKDKSEKEVKTDDSKKQPSVLEEDDKKPEIKSRESERQESREGDRRSEEKEGGRD